VVTESPLVVLIDGNSASASEIVSGALQDYGGKEQRALWIAGERSFGKATVQTNAPDSAIIPEIDILSSDLKGLDIFYTVARFYLPSNRTTQIRGVIPDFTLPPVPHPTADDWLVSREEDQYTNALPPLGNDWVQPRTREIQQVEACTAKDQDRINKIYDQEMSDVGFSDYRLNAGVSLVGCLVH
jgi:hypothetical protein